RRHVRRAQRTSKREHGPTLGEKLARAQPQERAIDDECSAHRSTRYEKTLSSDSSVGRISSNRMPASRAARGRWCVSVLRSDVRTMMPHPPPSAPLPLVVLTSTPSTAASYTS